MGSSLVCLLLAFFRTSFFHNPSWLQSLKWKFSFTLYFLLVSSFLWFSCQPTSPTRPRAYKGFCPILLLANKLTTAHAVKLYGKYLPRKKHWNIRLLLGNHQGAIGKREAGNKRRAPRTFSPICAVVSLQWLCISLFRVLSSFPYILNDFCTLRD